MKNRDANFPINSWHTLTDLYQQFPYIISYNDKSINVALYDNITQKEMIMAYFHAFILGVIINESKNAVNKIVLT